MPKAVKWHGGLKGGRMKNEILEQLVKLRLNYHKPYSAEELDLMAEDWTEIIIRKHISIDVFVEACVLHRSGSEYFPSVKHIIDRCNEVWNERRRNIKKLPEPIPDLTPEQIRDNTDRARKRVKGMLKKVKNLGPIAKRSLRTKGIG